MKPVEVGESDYHKVRMRVIDVQRVGFCYLKVDMRLVDVGNVRFQYPKECMRRSESV